MADRVKIEGVSGPRTAKVNAQHNTQFADGLLRNAERTTQQIRNLNNNVNDMLDDKVIAEAERAGMEAGAAQNFKVLHEDTLAAKAFNRAARQTYLTSIETDTRRKFDEMFEQHKNDPSALKSALEGYRGGTIAELKQADETLIPLYEEIYDRHSRALIKESHKNALQVQRETEIASTMSAIENGIKSTERLASIEDSDELFEIAVSDERELVVAKITDLGPPQAFEFEGIQYEADTTRSGAIGVDDMAAIVADLDDRVAVSRVMGKFNSAKDKTQFLSNFEKDASDVFSSEQRERLASKMRTEIRAERTEQNARRALLKDNVTDMIFVLDRGHTPAGYDSMIQATSEFPELQQDLIIANTQKELSSEFVKSTPLEQINEINRIESAINQGVEPARADIELMERYRRLHVDTMEGLRDDPVSWGNKAGLYELSEIKSDDPQTLLARSQVAEQLRDRYGIVTHGLTEVEVSTLENELEHGDSAEKMTLFASYNAAMTDDQFGALMAEIAPKQPVYSFAAALTPDAPKLSHEVVRGQILTEDPEIRKFLPAKTDYQGVVDDFFGDAFKHNPTAMSQALQSALAVDLLRRQNAGKLDDFDDSDLTDILEEVTGGVFEFNGQKILSPRRGMTENTFEDIIDRVSDDDLIMNGQTPKMSNGDRVTANMLRDHGVLENIGQSTYLIKINGFYAQDGTGEPFELEFEEMIRQPNMGGQIKQ